MDALIQDKLNKDQVIGNFISILKNLEDGGSSYSLTTHEIDTIEVSRLGMVRIEISLDPLTQDDSITFFLEPESSFSTLTMYYNISPEQKESKNITPHIYMNDRSGKPLLSEDNPKLYNQGMQTCLYFLTLFTNKINEKISKRNLKTYEIAQAISQGIYNNKAKEPLFDTRTDIHGVYRYSDLDMDRLNQSPLYEHIETRSRNEFRDQEAMDSKENINRFDVFIPEGIDLNDYNGDIVVGTRKNQSQQEDIFDLFCNNCSN